VDRQSPTPVSPDAVELGYLARYEGIEAIDRGFREMGERDRFFIKQFVHDHDVEVDGNTATGRSYLEARYGRYGVSYLVAGRYDDAYVFVDGTWKFRSMIAEIFYAVPNGVGRDELRDPALHPRKPCERRRIPRIRRRQGLLRSYPPSTGRLRQ
jgi:hypothetical protein